MKKLLALLALLLTLNLLALAQTPRTAQDYVRRGIARYTRGNLDAAIADYNAALRADPRHAEAYLRRGDALRAKDELDEALEDYARAIELDPQLPRRHPQVSQAFGNRGMIRLNDMNVGGALADLDKAIEYISPAAPYLNHAETYRNRAEARLLNDDLEGAIADYNRCIELAADRPQSTMLPMAYAGRGFARLLQGKEAEAQQDFDRVSTKDFGGGMRLEHYLFYLEVQRQELQRRRAETLRRAT